MSFIIKYITKLEDKIYKAGTNLFELNKVRSLKQNLKTKKKFDIQMRHKQFHVKLLLLCILMLILPSFFFLLCIPQNILSLVVDVREAVFTQK
jgi:CRISPR/Cas system CMR-associated protein Cmr1 (group 7 of RAMP superfamily)